MKIGIITYWQSDDNYGQQLQCWALQQYLMQMGHAPYLIRYDANFVAARKKSLKEKVLMIIAVKPLIAALKRKWKIYQHRIDPVVHHERRFAAFRESHIQMSQTIYKGLQDLRNNPPEADIYITGSDQVWANLLDREESETYFLNFGNEKVHRIAYAPSFSMPRYPEQLKGRLKEQLSHFDAISVREETGKRICEEIGLEATTVLDPTLLLTPSKYETLIEGRKSANYVYVYHLNVESAKELAGDKIQSFSRKHGFQLKATTASGYLPGKELLDEAQYEYSTIPQWMDNIKQAEIVFTPSFHGVVFSLIFHTRVVFIPLKGPRGRGNNRVVDLFKELGLDYFIYDENVDMEEYYHHPIDWESIDSKLNVMRATSIDFLKNNIDTENTK